MPIPWTAQLRDRTSPVFAKRARVWRSIYTVGVNEWIHSRDSREPWTLGSASLVRPVTRPGNRTTSEHANEHRDARQRFGPHFRPRIQARRFVPHRWYPSWWGPPSLPVQGSRPSYGALVTWKCLTCTREGAGLAPSHCPWCTSESDDNHGPHAYLAYAVFYQTATLSKHASERDAWIAHDIAVCTGLNPDALAVGRIYK